MDKMKRYDPKEICDNLRVEIGASGAGTGHSSAAGKVERSGSEEETRLADQNKLSDGDEMRRDQRGMAGEFFEISIPVSPSKRLYPETMGQIEGSIRINEVPSGAPMRFMKRVIQRFLRIVTARQVDFNSSTAYALRVLVEHAESVQSSLSAIVTVLDRNSHLVERALDEHRRALEEYQQTLKDHDATLRDHHATLEVHNRALNVLSEGQEFLLHEEEEWGKKHLADRAGKAIFDRLKVLEECVEGLRGSQRQMLGAIQNEMRKISVGAPVGSNKPLGGGASPAVGDKVIQDVAYRLYEDQWRGSAEGIAAAQAEYVSLLQLQLEKLSPERREVLDIGFGRGEFLKALKSKGYGAVGVDINGSSIVEAREAGLEVEEGDAIEYLSAQPDNRFGAITAFQVVEHLSVDALRELTRLVCAKLAPGGVALFETINPGTFAAFRWFYMDLSHTRLIPPESLRFLCECAGMEHLETRLIHPPADYERLAETGDDTERENIRRLNKALFGPQDYYLLVRKESNKGNDE